MVKAYVTWICDATCPPNQVRAFEMFAAHVETRQLDMRKRRLAILSDLFAESMAAVGKDVFPAKLGHFLELTGGYESTVIAAFPRGRQPTRLFSNLSGHNEISTIGPYFDKTYMLDTWYNMIMDRTPDGVYRLSEYAPDDFFKSTYYHTYYRKTLLVDECAVLIWLDSEICIALMLGNRSATGEVKLGILEELEDLLPCISLVVKQHWSGLTIEISPPGDSLVELCQANGLTKRESEVINYLLRGHSSKVIAREMMISPETVKVYRKRINQKLGTSSTSQVFAKFFPYM